MWKNTVGPSDAFFTPAGIAVRITSFQRKRHVKGSPASPCGIDHDAGLLAEIGFAITGPSLEADRDRLQTPRSAGPPAVTPRPPPCPRNTSPGPILQKLPLVARTRARRCRTGNQELVSPFLPARPELLGSLAQPAWPLTVKSRAGLFPSLYTDHNRIPASCPQEPRKPVTEPWCAVLRGSRSTVPPCRPCSSAS